MLQCFRQLEEVCLTAWKLDEIPLIGWEDELPEYAQHIAAWLRSCSHLRTLTLRSTPFLQPIFIRAFESSPIRLRSLELTFRFQHVTDAMFEALSKQTGLRELKIRGRGLMTAPEPVHQGRRQKFVQVITSMRELRTLAIAEVLQHDNLKCIIQSLPKLMHIDLTVQDLDDQCIETLSGLVRAQTIKLCGLSSTATATATRRLLEAVAVNGVCRRFNQLFILFRTLGRHEGFTEKDLIALKQLFKTECRGIGRFYLRPRPWS
jgi:hypothetical protein